jgi:surface antigen
MSRRTRSVSATVALVLSVLLAAPVVLADPPAHAPAHGWRAKHDPYYLGYAGNHWERDYGVRAGHCDRHEVATVVGAMVGGAVGSTVGEGDSKLIAILVGSAIGAVIGREIGRDMDSSDRACIGHALELAEDGHGVRWSGATAGLSYELTPTAGFERSGQPCRQFTLVRQLDGRSRKEAGSACRVGNGEWQLLGG